jgi:predicted GH43/DUF377 family glycosyl hydrolase
MSGFQLQRLGQMMEPEPGNPQEAEGVLNPAAVRGPDGKLYLFPRLVARGNYSRFGIARVRFNDAGDPSGVERFGIALEPEQMAMLHRPLFPGTRPEETACKAASRVVDLDHESIWISYCPMALEGLEPQHLGLFNSHHRLATPVSPWERLKMGGGTPPILTRHGWLIVYHGVHEVVEPGNDAHPLCYAAGVMVLSKEHPRVILYRSAEPVLTPVLPQERHGTIPNVVFPTGIDRRDDLGSPDRFDVYYGMADNRIGVASLHVPEHLPPGALADDRDQKSKLSLSVSLKAHLETCDGNSGYGEQHSDRAERRAVVPARGQETRDEHGR